MRSLFAAIVGVFAVFVVARRRPMCLRAGARLARRLSNVATSLRLRGARGAIVSRIDPGSPASRQIVGLDPLRRFVAEAKPGLDAVVEVVRNGRRQAFRVTIGESAPGSATTDKS